MYISQKFREKMVMMLGMTIALDQIIEDDERCKPIFGNKAWGWIKQANTLIQKAYHEGVVPEIGSEEAKKIAKHASQYNIILMHRTAPLPDGETFVSTEHLHNLAEMAMANKCVGCTITKYKECSLYESLNHTTIPEACAEKGKCPYVQ